ncbi:MFS transporter [Actinomycetota bacterium]
MTVPTAEARVPLSPKAAERIYLLLNLTRWFPVGLIVGLFILIQTSRGLSVAEAMTAIAATGVACALFELPTSGFADALGRRPVYLAAAALNVLVAYLYAVADSFWAFAAASALMGVFRALDSGPLEAWFVDTVHETSPGADVDQPLARAGTTVGIAMAAGSAISGLLVWWHPIRSMPAIDLPVWVYFGLTIAHLLAVLFLLRETPRGHDATRLARALRSMRETPSVVASGLRLLRTNRVLRALVLVEIFWATGMLVFESFASVRLAELVGGETRAGALIGPVAAGGWAVFALGSALAGWASRRHGVARAAILGRALNGIGAVVMGLTAGPVALIAAYLFAYGAHGMNGAPHSALLHREAESSNRATVLSINSMVSFLAFSIASTVMGHIAGAWSIQAAMVIAGAFSILGVFCYLPALRHEQSGRLQP